MYDEYDQRYVHREATQWHLQRPPSKTWTVSYALDVDPGRYIAMPIHQVWHRKLADVKGYESEPDEGRRTKTPYAKHYARRTVSGFDSPALRTRARSYESLKLSFRLRRS